VNIENYWPDGMKKTNPIQTQFNPIQSQFNPKQTQFKPNLSRLKPKTNPNNSNSGQSTTGLKSGQW